MSHNGDMSNHTSANYGGTETGQLATLLTRMHHTGQPLSMLGDVIENVLDMANDPTWDYRNLDRHSSFWREVRLSLESELDANG